MLTKYLKSDGTGDYTNITTAFDDMLVSGLVGSGDITDYFLICDGVSYSGTFSGYIPYSGSFTIFGNGSIIYLSDNITNLSGEYSNEFTPNILLQDITLSCSGLSNNCIYIPSGFSFKLSDVQFIDTNSGIYNSGILQLDHVTSCGISGSSDYFINSISGTNLIYNTDISNYNTAIIADNINLINSNIAYNSTGVYYTNNYEISIDNTLFNNTNYELYLGSGNLVINHSTFNNLSYQYSGYSYIDSSIFKDGNISGVIITGYLIDSCLSENDILASNLSGNNNRYEDPKFNNTSINDFRLQFEQTNGSNCIEHKYNSNYDESIDITLDQTKLQIFDNQGNLSNQFIPYIYVQDSSIVFTDYNKEIQYAKLIDIYKNLYYNLYINLIFDEYNIKTESSFNRVDDIDNYPYDWDYKQIYTTKIESDKYIIPRSVINIENIILNKIKNLPNNLSFSDIGKNNIKVYIKDDLRGICYDHLLSTNTKSIIWVIDGRNQSLIKKNTFTDETYNNYPLLCAEYKTFVKPSGLIYTGVNGDKYKYLLESDPSVEIEGDTENGNFNWLNTELNNNFDLRGVFLYEDYLFITCSKYDSEVLDRHITPTEQAQGMLLWYYNNDTFLNYTNSISNVAHSFLASGNYYPTDITLYEDGSLLVADYRSLSGIYKYNLAYDYALINNTYNNTTRVLLREDYIDVDL